MILYFESEVGREFTFFCTFTFSYIAIQLNIFKMNNSS